MPTDATARPADPTAPVQVAPGIFAVAIPLHVRTEPANAYLLCDDDGAVTVFDTGIAAGADELWPRALASIGATAADVARIVVSHHHPDHIGGAGVLHRLTGAPVLASPSTVEQAPDVWGDAGRMEAYFDSMRAHLHEHGLPDRIADMLAGEADVVRMAVDLPPDDSWRPLVDGELLEAAGRTWQAIATPGHADGHLVLLDVGPEGLLLAADHLLERISPAVGRFPRHAADPLAGYLSSLERIAAAPVGTILPGHGAPFTGAAARAQALLEHHRTRIDRSVAAVDGIGDATAFDAAGVVFHKVFNAPDADAANLRFATTETLAHLERARFDGRLVRARGADGLVRYRSPGG
ncbi:MAG: fold metallo-hydrolase [Thermoleophilia bacterium]|nr:fold metallo-hydrolase [Thermoleophilia bacterium]